MITAEFKRRVFEENFQRIFSCLDKLTEDQVWQNFNDHTNSVGNLILHLAGNAQQWVVSTFGNMQDNRNRSAEFEIAGEFTKNELKGILEELKLRIELTIATLEEDQLTKTYNVQCYKESGFSILVHVLEHFSYHTGQIALLTKLIVNQDLGFYANDKLSKTQ